MRTVENVKTDDANRPSPQYRNEAIFESAQRLLASRPSAKPSRWKFFAGGILLGLAGGFLGLQAWMRIHAAQSSTEPTPVTAARSATAPRPPAPSPAPAPTSPTPETTAAQSAPAVPATVGTDTGTDAAAAKGAGALLNDSAKAAEDFFGANLPAGSGVFWVGEMLSENADPVSIEFTFRAGVPSRDGLRGIARVGGVGGNSIVGEIQNHTLTLHEADAVWIFANGVPADSPLLKSGRQFVIQFPDGSATQLTGTWTFGNASGTLKLTVLRL